jgi:tetratricopeptide (TPR) repeat protein
VAQLIDASTGDHVWGERYDREGTDALALQDEVVEKVIGSLAGNHGLIRKKEYERSWGKDRASLEEYDYYLLGHHLWDRFTREDTHQAIAVWREGLDRFPESSLLRIKVGWGYFQLAYGGWSTDFAGDVQRAFELAEQGLAGKNLPPIGKYSGHSLMAWLQIFHKNDWEEALREREIVLAVNPNDPVSIATMAELAIQAGRPDEAIASLQRDVAWDSAYYMASPHFRLGMAYFMKGAYPTALEHLKRESNLGPLYTLTFLAATYAELGQIDEARATVARILKAKPEASLALIRALWPFRYEADTERLIGALRKAGLPDA